MILDVNLLSEGVLLNKPKTYDITDKKTKRIYLVFTNTGSLVAKVIKTITSSPYNHVSISFTGDIDSKDFVMYTFNLTRDGFERERTTSFVNITTYSMYYIEVEEVVFDKIEKHIEYMERHMSEYKYSVTGLFAYWMSIPYEKKGSYFCSQFIATLFNKAGMPLFGVPASLLSPKDIMQHPSFVFVRRGKLYPKKEEDK